MMNRPLVCISLAIFQLLAKYEGAKVNGEVSSRHLEDKQMIYAAGKEYANFAAWVSSKEFQGEGGRCKTLEPSEEEVKISNDVVNRWVAQNPCEEGSQNPLCLDTMGSRSVTRREVTVHLHVILTDEGEGEIEDSVLERQIEVLNDAFSPDFLFKFSVSDVDRTRNSTWYQGKGAHDMRATLREGECHDLNVWINGKSDTLGYATYPIRCIFENNIDGVVILNESLPGGNAAPYNLGHTLTHEVGHWLGLYHTFQGSCHDFDLVPDTPAELVPAYGCPIGRDTCPGKGADPITNFMDYSDDSCMLRFTKGQRMRMIAHWASFRDSVGDDHARERAYPSLKQEECPQGQHLFAAFLRFDRFPQDTSWSLRNSCTNQIVAEGGPYPNQQFTNEAKCLPDSSYMFTLNDDYSDGICCASGYGGFDIFFKGASVFRGGNFGATTSTTFGKCANINGEGNLPRGFSGGPLDDTLLGN